MLLETKNVRFIGNTIWAWIDKEKNIVDVAFYDIVNINKTRNKYV